ncbi:hypothetical protein [Nocardia sp. NPDC048505]|uniref:hypothetical protein n=1 Tax=unclassified Nocardia TaxID=2637762 RepID=UPI0033DDE655
MSRQDERRELPLRVPPRNLECQEFQDLPQGKSQFRGPDPGYFEDQVRVDRCGVAQCFVEDHYVDRGRTAEYSTRDPSRVPMIEEVIC